MTAGVIITGNKMTIANSQQENVDATEVADPIPITVGQTTDIPSTIIIKPHQNITTTTTTITQSTTDLLKEKLKTIKNNVRTGPSPLRQLLPIIVCLISFATVLSMLVIYMDTTGETLLDFAMSLDVLKLILIFFCSQKFVINNSV